MSANGTHNGSTGDQLVGRVLSVNERGCASRGATAGSTSRSGRASWSRPSAAPAWPSRWTGPDSSERSGRPEKPVPRRHRFLALTATR